MASRIYTEIDERRRQALILRIARAAFLRDGYSATSMASIAAKVGGSKTTLYRRYPSKQDLFIAVCQLETEKIVNRLFAIEFDVSDIETALHDFCVQNMNVFLDDDVTAFHRIVIGEGGKFPQVGHEAHKANERLGRDRMERVLKKAMEAGQLRQADPRDAAELLYDLGIAFQHKVRLWNSVKNVTPQMIEKHVAYMMTVFFATFGNEELSRKARGAQKTKGEPARAR